MYTEDFTPLSSELLTQGDLTTLCFMMRAMEPFRNYPAYRNKVRSAVQKISTTLRQELASISRTSNAPSPSAPPVSMPTSIPKPSRPCSPPILGQQELQIDYIKLHDEEEETDPCRAHVPMRHPPAKRFENSGGVRTEVAEGTKGASATGERPTSPLSLPAPERRTVRTLHLLCFDNVWYPTSGTRSAKTIPRFALSRMQSVKRTGRTFKPRRFNIQKN
jgi:predicted DNA-binding transcriptional regulator YafY